MVRGKVPAVFIKRNKRLRIERKNMQRFEYNEMIFDQRVATPEFQNRVEGARLIMTQSPLDRRFEECLRLRERAEAMQKVAKQREDSERRMQQQNGKNQLEDQAGRSEEPAEGSSRKI